MYTARYTDSDGDAAPVDDRTRSSMVYDELKRRLLFGDFRIGRRLAEVALSEQLAVSRTPVREALTRLHAEGFVVRLPEGGFSPAAPDLHTIGELYVVRRGLELTALRIDEGHDEAALTTLRDDWLALTPRTEGDPEFVLHDEDFHIRLAASAGNSALVDMLTLVSERIRVVRIYDFLTADRIAKTIEEHLSIVDALLEGEQRAAERCLVRHVHISRQVVEQRSAMALSRMVHGQRDV